MEYRKLGHTGLFVSELCLGTMQFGWTADEDTSFTILNEAFAAGINFIDTADVYSRWVQGNPGGVSESIIGNWWQQAKIHREQIVIATKVRGRMGEGPNDEGLSRAHIFSSVEASLRRLKTDYIDLYQAHWFDENIQIEETMQAFADLVHQGKVRYVGCSNYPAWRLMQALWTTDRKHLARFDSLQPHYNLLHRAEFERELAEVCQVYNIGVIPYSPLAGGFLTGKYRKNEPPQSARARGVKRYFSDKNFAVIDRLAELGQHKNHASVSQLALAWLLTNPLVSSAIIGPRTLEQLQDNLGAVGLRLTTEEKAGLDAVTDWKNQP
jgi:aryl-alcohol dehydrogenase-like predicted oxidoreductase